MQKRKITIHKPLEKEKKSLYQIQDTSDQIHTLWKHPLTKTLVIVGSVYGILFISKYIISEFAEVVIATKKLKNANKL